MRPNQLALLPLGHEHDKTFTSAAGLDEFSHGQFVAAVAALSENSHKFGRAFRQDYVVIEHDRIATKMNCFFLFDIDKLVDVFGNRALTVFVKRSRKPNCITIWQRAKACIEMIKTRIDKLYRDDKAAEHVCHRKMRLDIGSELVPAEKCFARKKCIALALEIEIIGEPFHLIVVLLHPLCEMGCFSSALLVPEIARDKFLPDSQAGIGGKNHVG